MNLSFVHGNILDQKADGLISSGNVQLNMSGGINGALLTRYGQLLQDELTDYKTTQKRQFVDPGFVYKFKQKIGAYLGVTYSVAVDGWYDSSIELVSETLVKSIRELMSCNCRVIAFGALGTGYGNLSKEEFGIALRVLQLIEEPVDLVLVEQDQIGLAEIIEGYKG